MNQNCAQVCNELNKGYDQSVVLDGELDIYDDVKRSQSCQLPLLSTCNQTAPSRGTDGLCYVQDESSDRCGPPPQDMNICDAPASKIGAEILCPCGDILPSDDDDSNSGDDDNNSSNSGDNDDNNSNSGDNDSSDDNTHDHDA